VSIPLDDRLRALALAAPTAGIFSDFDGCLAPIVPDPEAAMPLPGAAELLARLARSFAVVAVVSGRPVSFLAGHLDAAGVRLVGLYGLEEQIGGAPRIAPAAEEARAAIRRAHDRLVEAVAVHPGVYVEDKALSVAVHFRRAPDPDEAMRWGDELVTGVAEAEGLTVQRGRLVCEVRPPGGGDKGHAVARLMLEAGITHGLVAGDDAGDIAAFDAVAGLDCLRVAVTSSESPRELLDRADLTVAGPEGYLALLSGLADATDP